MSPFMKSCLPQKSLTLPITPRLKELASHVALARKKGHDHCRQPSDDLGSADKNLAADYAGVLGEVVVYDALERMGHKPRYTLLSNAPPAGPDFTLFPFSYSIKTVPDGSFYLSVNERQRLDPKYVSDFYLPVLLSNGTASIYQPIPASEVATWELREGHTPYRSIPVSELTPINSLEEIF